MRNKLTLILLLLSIILLIIVMFFGIDIGNIHILSLADLKDKNDDLNTQITTASELTSVKYSDTIKDLEKTYEKFTIEKEKYEEISDFTNDEDKKDIYETKQYDIGYLWKTLGRYATSNNLKLGMEVQKSNNGDDLYNLKFSVSGEYVNISEFIADIENDSDLYFRIYNFKMTGNEAKISATFTVKDVRLDSSTITTVKETPDDNETEVSEEKESNEVQNTIEE